MSYIKDFAWKLTPFVRAVFGASEKIEEYTATGNPVTFETDVAKPLRSLLIPFTPVQSGSGDPSPQNIRSILPWNGLKVYHSGADTSEYTETDIVFPSPVYGGELEAVSGKLMDAFKSVDLGSKSWRLRSENQSRQVWECVCNDAKFGREGNTYTANAISSEFSLTTSNSAWSVGKFAPALSNNDKVFIFSVPAGSYANATECKEAMDGIQLCYELINSAKQEIQLTPAQITALVGDNTIWSDADGSMTAVYLKKG